MMKTTQEGRYETGEVVERGVVMSIQEIHHDLERLTLNLDKHLPSIGASKMPEYIQARNAVKKYELAIQGKIRLLNGTVKSEE